jgi:OPA family sugar phosphate sensor protein UhpC-like MFS transporter
MGLVGVFSYLGAAVQENISGSLIESGMTVVGDARTYDFGPAIVFWVSSSVISMLLAATLWKVKLRE